MLKPNPREREVRTAQKTDASASPYDRGHEHPQPVPGDATMLRARGDELQSPFQLLPDRLGLTEVRAYQVHLVSTWCLMPGVPTKRSAPCARSSARRSLRGHARQRPASWSILRTYGTANTLPAGSSILLKIGVVAHAIVKPLASMIPPWDLEIFPSPSPPLPRRVGGDHIEENGRRISPGPATGLAPGNGRYHTQD